MGISKQIVEKANTLFKVLIFSVTIFGMLMILGFMYKKSQGYNELPLAFIEQCLVYIGVITFGVIICLTDVIISKCSMFIRIPCFGGGLYLISLVNFLNHPINPLQNIEIFMLYTLYFICIVSLLCLAWYIYQSIISNKYTQYIGDYQNELKDME